MNYSAKEAAEKLGITKDTLLYYEKEGILPVITRDEANRRVYSESDIEWIYLIRCLRDTDMPICKIKQYVSLLKKEGTGSVQERKGILEEHKLFIKEKLEKYQRLLLLIDKKLDFYEEALNSEKSDEVKCMDYATEWQHFRESIGELKHEE